MGGPKQVKVDVKGQEEAKKFAHLPDFNEAVARTAEGNGRLTRVDEGLYYVLARKTLNIMGGLSKYVSYMGQTMTIVKEGENVSLINTAQLIEEDMQEIDKLGKVKHIVRIGACHGSSDPFFLKRYPQAEYWIVEGMTTHEGLPVKPRYLTPHSAPLKGMKVFLLPGGKLPEAQLYLPMCGGVLITADSLQNNQGFLPPFCSFMMSLFLQFGGFKGPARIGPGWLQFGYEVWGVDPGPVLSEFLTSTVLKENISILMPGHGLPLSGNVNQLISESVTKQLT